MSVNIFRLSDLIPITKIGGHKVLDESGTSLTQRKKLKFINATIEDDALNDMTIITFGQSENNIGN